jgi:hypothetical protein
MRGAKAHLSGQGLPEIANIAIQSNPSTSDASPMAHNNDIQEVRGCEANLSWRGLDISKTTVYLNHKPRVDDSHKEAVCVFKHVATVAEDSMECDLASEESIRPTCSGIALLRGIVSDWRQHPYRWSADC